MTRIARSQHELLTLVVGLVAALVWTSLGVRAIAMDTDPSAKALFACLALVLAAFALGSATWTLTASRRAKRPGWAAASAQMRAPSAMLGIMVIGLGADPILDPSTNAWGWTFMVIAALAGGLNLGVAFMGIVDQAATSDAAHQPTAAPQSDG